MWEEHQLLSSGIGQRKEIDLNFDPEEETSVQLMVHSLVPPFLDGRVALSRQSEMVEPVIDPTCDMAMMAKAGSKLARFVRQKREKERAVRDQFRTAGTTLGILTGEQENKHDTRDEVGGLVGGKAVESEEVHETNTLETEESSSEAPERNASATSDRMEEESEESLRKKSQQPVIGPSFSTDLLRQREERVC